MTGGNVEAAVELIFSGSEWEVVGRRTSSVELIQMNWVLAGVPPSS